MLNEPHEQCRDPTRPELNQRSCWMMSWTPYALSILCCVSERPWIKEYKVSQSIANFSHTFNNIVPELIGTINAFLQNVNMRQTFWQSSSTCRASISIRLSDATLVRMWDASSCGTKQNPKKQNPIHKIYGYASALQNLENKVRYYGTSFPPYESNTIWLYKCTVYTYIYGTRCPFQ